MEHQDQVFRELFLSYKGKEYKVVPTMAVMRAIEMKGISVPDVVARTADGKPPMALISDMYAALLRSVGVTLTDEQAYAGLVGDAQDEMIKRVGLVLMAFNPVIAEGKNQDAPTETQSNAGATASP